MMQGLRMDIDEQKSETSGMQSLGITKRRYIN
jgi:hypothetical protein